MNTRQSPEPSTDSIPNTSLEQIQLIFSLIWFFYAFFLNPVSNFQTGLFILILGLIVINAILTRVHAKENLAERVSSQIISFSVIYWIFLLFKANTITGLEVITIEGYTFQSIFQLQQYMLGLLIVLAGFFQQMNLNLIFRKSNEDRAANYLALSGQIIRGIGYAGLVLVTLSWLEWFPNITNSSNNSLDAFDIIFSVSIASMLLATVILSSSRFRTTSHKHTKMYGKTSLERFGRESISSGIIILVLINFRSFLGIFQLSSEFYIKSFWNEISFFFIFFGIVTLIAESNKDNSSSTRTRRSRRSRRTPRSPKIKESPKKEPDSAENKINISSTMDTSPKELDTLKKFIRVVNITITQQSIPLTKLITKLGFTTIDELDNWFINLGIDSLEIDWTNNTLFISEQLKEDLAQFQVKNSSEKTT